MLASRKAPIPPLTSSQPPVQKGKEQEEEKTRKLIGRDKRWLSKQRKWKEVMQRQSVTTSH